MLIRKAAICDAEGIHKLVTAFALKGVMLPRSLNSIYDNIRDFWVIDEDGVLVGCAALHIVGWEGLAEVRSLSVMKEAQGNGYGRILVERCIEEAKDLGVKKLFALTFVPDFFARLGFALEEKDKLPHKIWSDCIDCPFFPNCTEVAVIIHL